MNISLIAPQQINLIIENTIRKNEFFITLYQIYKLKTPVLEKYHVYIDILILKVNENELSDSQEAVWSSKEKNSTDFFWILWKLLAS